MQIPPPQQLAFLPIAINTCSEISTGIFMKRASRRKYHYFYKITNLLNNKFYYGIHSTDNLEDGYFGSGVRLRYSINKYGKENHKMEILEYFDDRESLRNKEKEVVNENLLSEPLCMNLSQGGGAGWDYVNKTPKPKEWYKKGAVASNKIRSTRHLEKMKNKEYRASFSESCSTGQKNRYAKGLQNPMLGQKHSEATKEKMASSKTGEKNPNYGRCWIYNPTEDKAIMIGKELVCEMLQRGWVKGRC